MVVAKRFFRPDQRERERERERQTDRQRDRDRETERERRFQTEMFTKVNVIVCTS